MEWLNEPASWSSNEGDIDVHADPQTDFWRITGYGYVRDNAHIYGESLTSDFDLTVKIRANYLEQYDQAGAAVRISESRWIKTGIELFEGKLRFSTVVTVENSSWMFADLPNVFEVLNLSLARRGDAIEISQSTDEETPRLASIVYTEPGSPAFTGIMCASPSGEGFATHFSQYKLTAS
jgi:uncharacterized protein